MNRREFLQAALASAVAAGMSRYAPGAESKIAPPPPVNPSADAMILIWLPGGVAQTDTWDPKAHTPFRKGMKARELRGTCPIIKTTADDIFLGKGLENLATVMDKGLILRSLANDVMFGAL